MNLYEYEYDFISLREAEKSLLLRVQLWRSESAVGGAGTATGEDQKLRQDRNDDSLGQVDIRTWELRLEMKASCLLTQCFAAPEGSSLA